MPIKIKIWAYWLKAAIRAQMEGGCRWWQVSICGAVYFANFMMEK